MPMISWPWVAPPDAIIRLESTGLTTAPGTAAVLPARKPTAAPPAKPTAASPTGQRLSHTRRTIPGRPPKLHFTAAIARRSGLRNPTSRASNASRENPASPIRKRTTARPILRPPDPHRNSAPPARRKAASASTHEKLAGMKTTKNAPTTASRLTTAVPPPKYARARMPIALAIGIATVSATMARMRRSSLVASRKSRRATSAALCRSRFSKLMVVAHYREVDVLQRRQLAKLSARLETGAAAELGHVADRQRATRRHDSNLLPQDLGLLHAVRAYDERAPVLLQALQVIPRATGAVGIERGRRLVGQDESWSMQSGADQSDFLTHAFRVRAQPAIGGVEQVELSEQVFDSAAPQGRLEVVDRAEVIEVGSSRHALVQTRDLGHHPHLGAHRGGVGCGVGAVDLHRARRRHQHAGHAAQGGRLAGAVATEKDQAAAFAHPHRQVAESQHLAVPLGEPINLEHAMDSERRIIQLFVRVWRQTRVSGQGISRFLIKACEMWTSLLSVAR